MTHDVKWLRFRILFVLAAFFLIFGVVFARAFELQTLDAQVLRSKAQGQHIKTFKRRAERGGIYDRNQNELAVSLDVDSIYANPARIIEPVKTAKELAPIVGLKNKEVLKKLKSKKSFVWVKRQADITDTQRKTIKAIAGIDTLKKSRRYYPNRQIAANILGFEGIDAKGLEGIELYYDEYLKGRARKVKGERDARGRTLLYEDVEKTAITRGMNVTLTIDKTVQHITERALAKAVTRGNAKGGTAVVMDPATGEILAMAALPTYDPNNFHRTKPSSWRNRAVTDIFEPGSVMKGFLLAAVLEEGVADEKKIFFCENGKYKVADRTFHDTKKHAWLTLAQIIKYSSNIGAAKVGRDLGEEGLYRYYKRFGFGEKTGIDLPGEGRGIFRHHTNWSRVSLETLAFGQGISVNAVQLTTAMAAIANGGYLMKPYILKNVSDMDGNIVLEGKPKVVNRVVSEETATRTTEVLKRVTESEGTGRNAAVEGFSVAGKTGTAQKADPKKAGYKKNAYVASFLGFVPANDPKLVIFVAVDEPEAYRGYHTGGIFAAPVFKEIAEQTLSYKGIFPEGKELGEDSPPVYEVRAIPSPDSAPVKKGRVPNFKGKSMRMVLRMTDSIGADLEVNGSGIAYNQLPVSGASYSVEEPMQVWFR